MSLIAAMTIAIATKVTPVCVWDDRGRDKFYGDLVEAVDTYKDIPKNIRVALQAKIALRDYDEFAHITGQGITGKDYRYGPLTQMHFGSGICGQVVINWPATDEGERGLVYCVEGHCLIIPTVCRNMSRIERLGPRYPGLRMSMMAQKKDEPPAPLIEIPPTTEIVLPPIVSDAELPPVSFAAQLDPKSVVQEIDEPVRISAWQTFFDYEQWRPLLRERRSLPPITSSIGPINWVPPASLVTAPPAIPSVPGLIVTTNPVPGVAPPRGTTDGRVRLPPSSSIQAPPASVPGVPFETPLKQPPKEPSKGFDEGGAPLTSVTPVPEPSTWFLMFVGLAWAIWQARKVAFK